MSNRVTHFEIPSSNPEETMSFFKSTFGWNFQQMGSEEYWFAITGDDNESGINGAIMKRKHPEQPLTNAISVDNIDLTIHQIAKNGGTLVVEKTPVPEAGWLAFFKDPDGNIHGLWQDDKKAE